MHAVCAFLMCVCMSVGLYGLVGMAIMIPHVCLHVCWPIQACVYGHNDSSCVSACLFAYTGLCVYGHNETLIFNLY